MDLATLLLIIGFGMVLIELFLPANMILPAASLFLSGITGVLLNINEIFYLALFTAIYGVLVFALLKKIDIFGEEKGSTSTKDDLVGKEAIVKEKVDKLDGKVKLLEGGYRSTYSARSNKEIPVGEKVRVTEGGTVLEVEEINRKS